MSRRSVIIFKIILKPKLIRHFLSPLEKSDSCVVLRRSFGWNSQMTLKKPPGLLYLHGLHAKLGCRNYIIFKGVP